jgi:pyruvate/2-oxoglutarate dehydrogenase complex dihydrolipoamide acyltransferase (E2) component
MADKTYYYKKDVGDSKDVVIVAVHFKNAFRGADQDLATVDGYWQLSDTPTDVSENTEYDKMTIQTVTDNSIMMNNEDNDITLSNDKDISLMEGVRIKTADPSSDEGDVLRWYIYKAAVVEGEGAEAEPTAEAEAAAEEVAETPAVEETAVNETATAAAASTAAAAEAKVDEAAAAAKETVEESAVAAEEKVDEAAVAAEKKVNETAEAAKKEAPGFESIFAITGLLAVAYLVLGRRE